MEEDWHDHGIRRNETFRKRQLKVRVSHGNLYEEAYFLNIGEMRCIHNSKLVLLKGEENWTLSIQKTISCGVQRQGLSTLSEGTDLLQYPLQDESQSRNGAWNIPGFTVSVMESYRNGSGLTRTFEFGTMSPGFSNAPRIRLLVLMNSCDMS